MKPPQHLLDDRAFATADDQAVVAAAVTGSQPAARELVRRYERPVYNLLVGLLRDRSAAEDLSQDTFLKFFRTLRRYDPQYRLAAWILKMLTTPVSITFGATGPSWCPSTPRLTTRGDRWQRPFPTCPRRRPPRSRSA